MAKEVVSGVGTRYGVVFVNDTETGYPLPESASAVPTVGIEIEGIKSLPVTDPTPQRFTHYGNDGPIAQDTLPATEGGSFTITTAKSNLILDSVLEGTEIRDVNGVRMRIANSDQRGNEPLVTAMFYRQALDTKKGSGTFGKLRQYEGKIYGAVRISPASNAFEQGITDKTYNATPTMMQYTPWNEQINTTNWGASRGEYIEFTTDYHPRLAVWRGDGTITAFQLPASPVSDSYLHVWVDGTLTTPLSVDTSTTNPAFTLAVAPGVDKQVMALIETNTPSQL